MKSFPLTIALLLAAAPISAETPDIDDVVWDEPETLKAMVLECGRNISPVQCFDKARADSQKLNVPTYVIYHTMNGKTEYYRVGKNAIEPAYEEDVRTMISMDDNYGGEPDLPRNAGAPPVLTIK